MAGRSVGEAGRPNRYVGQADRRVFECRREVFSGARPRRGISLSTPLLLPPRNQEHYVNCLSPGWGLPRPLNTHPLPIAYTTWRPSAMAAFFGGPLAGTILMASNYRKLGQGSNGLLALVLGAAASVGVIYMALKTTANPAIARLCCSSCTVAGSETVAGGRDQDTCCVGRAALFQVARHWDCHRDIAGSWRCVDRLPRLQRTMAEFWREIWSRTE